MLLDGDVIEAVARLTPQWVAGFFDGEGSVSAEKSGASYTVRITITQKDPKILALIALKYGNGGMMSYHGANGAVCNRVRWAGRSALPFLRDVVPHVVVKRRAVEKAIELLELVSHTAERLTDEDNSRRKQLHDEIKALTRLGNVSGR